MSEARWEHVTAEEKIFAHLPDGYRIRMVRAIVDVPDCLEHPEAITDAIDEGDMDATVRTVFIVERKVPS